MTRWPFVLLLASFAGCGASSSRPTSGDPNWPALPPTQTATCGAATPMCPDAASLRVRWPEGAHAPADARLFLDRTSLDPVEAELGVCAAPGVHALTVGNARAVSVEILPGAETDVSIARDATGGWASTVTVGAIDIPSMLAALGRADLPTVGYDATPDERRTFAPQLAAAFDDWRGRLHRVTTLADAQSNTALATAAHDHEARSSSIALTISEDRPSADRLAAIRRAMETEVLASAEMVPIERTCPLYSFADPEPTLSPVTIEARPYVGTTTSVVRIRVAIDDVEVLDTGAPHGVELFDRTVVDGVVPPGDHVVYAEVTFADRGGTGVRRPIAPHTSLRVGRTSARVLVRALGDGTVEITTP